MEDLKPVVVATTELQVIFLKFDTEFQHSNGGQLELDQPETIAVDNDFYLLSKNKTTGNLRVIGDFECQTSKKVVDTFAYLKVGYIVCIETEADSKIQYFLNSHYNNCLDKLERFFKLVRWKYKFGERQLFYDERIVSWSLDRQSWNKMVSCPRPTNLRVTGVSHKTLDKAMLVGLIQENVDEPIFFEMLREANSISDYNIRSAFVMAVSALEVGVKYLIKKKIPAAAWLIDKLPSPPIVSIISEFFPQIIAGYSLSKQDGDKLKIVVNLRNQYVHSESEVISRESFYKNMDFINEFINYVIDSNL